MKVEVVDCHVQPVPPNVVITMTLEQAQMLYTISTTWPGLEGGSEEIIDFCTLMIKGLSDQRIYYWSPK